MNSGQSSSLAAAAAVKASTRKFYIRKKSELRVEVEPLVPFRVRLLFGTAEIFGTELPLRTWLSIPPYVKFAIFTWNGAMIELEGKSDVFVAYETPMMKYWNVHDNLDRRRARANAASNSCFVSSQCPRVTVIGPTDSGESSVCKILLSWACKKSWKPTFVDLDIGQGSVTIPGCIAATPVEMPIDAVEGISLEMPIVYFYRCITPRFVQRTCQGIITDP
ncbi:putative polyribonucleotide 5'-hydroxyl-kinase Clp1, P-loop domain, clp1 beta-sandwich [Dioscorea sansibarensis]